ncbi:MAG: putative RNA uridine N3 methyltransferase [Candidatus Thorarchaeota archaeon]
MVLKIALPDTSLIDCTDLRQKTVKVGQIARVLAVFRVGEVLVYNTGKLRPSQKRDADFLVKILRFMDTPQYLRRRVFPQSPSLQYAGLLPPLRTRSHPLQSTMAELTAGTVRWGIQVRPGKIDLGFDNLIDFTTTVSERDPTLFKVEATAPHLSLSVISRSEVPVYWGFETSRINDLLELLKNSRAMTRIGFSRKAPPFHKLEDDLKSTVSNTGSVLAVFGGPDRGILELCDSQREEIKRHIDFWANTIDDQGSETVRLEEALTVSLGLINNSIGKMITKPGFYE